MNASSWSEEDLKDPYKFYEMTVLLNAQREISDKILDAQWETKWHQDKVGGFCLSISCLPLCLFMVKGSTDQNRHMSLSGISCNEIMLNSICKLSQDHTLCFVSSQCSWYSWFLLQNSGCKAICGLLSCTQNCKLHSELSHAF